MLEGIKKPTDHVRYVASNLKKNSPEHTGVAIMMEHAADELDEKDALIAKYEDALKWYADKNKYNNHNNEFVCSEMEADYGHVAREALKGDTQ